MSTFWMAYGCLGCLPAQGCCRLRRSRSLSLLSLVSGLQEGPQTSPPYFHFVLLSENGLFDMLLQGCDRDEHQCRPCAFRGKGDLNSFSRGNIYAVQEKRCFQFSLAELKS